MMMNSLDKELVKNINNVIATMERNAEVLIEGKIPA